MRVLLFYQTLVDLTPLLQRPSSVTDIHLASIHFGLSSQGLPYIHLNDDWPDNACFDPVWTQLETATRQGIKVSLLIGGAGGGFHTLFEHYDECLSMLMELLKEKSFISGINLDVEETVSLENIRRLIRDLSVTGLTLSMSPVAGALVGDGPGLGGFSYKDLGKTPEASLVSYLCGQFYDDISFDARLYLDAVRNGFSASSLLLGSLGPLDKHQLSVLQDQVDLLSKTYGKSFGGICIWEYCLQPHFPFEIHV